MTSDRQLPFPLMGLPEELGGYEGWTPEVYQDLLEHRAGHLSRADLDRKYLRRRAILTLDMTDFTLCCMREDEVCAFLRILDAQSICLPVLREHGADLVRAFADDLVALFEDAGTALDAAFEMHRRVDLFVEQGLGEPGPARCCIGIGYGNVYAIGPNLAMGDEMNRASKLGEDIARGSETLVTSNVFGALRHRTDVSFERVAVDEPPFPFYRATPGPGC